MSSKPAKKTRYIPVQISKQVHINHHFECAWCGIQITEQHHIVEYSKSGDHSVGNLILLCDTCHRQVHANQIPHDELIKRQSTHLPADRLQANFVTTLSQLRFLVGSVMMETSILIQHGDNVLLKIELNEGNRLQVFCSFYNKKQELIFWMSKNRFWCTNDYIIQSDVDYLHIWRKSDRKSILEITRGEFYLVIYADYYCEGSRYSIKRDGFTINPSLAKNEPDSLIDVSDSSPTPKKKMQITLNNVYIHGTQHGVRIFKDENGNEIGFGVG